MEDRGRNYLEYEYWWEKKLGCIEENYRNIEGIEESLIYIRVWEKWKESEGEVIFEEIRIGNFLEMMEDIKL